MSILLMVVLMMMLSGEVNSQDLNKEVYVVRPYEPTLSDADKYNFLPSISSMETSIPAFQYSISPKRLTSSFEPDPIKAARTVTTSLPKIYNSWLKLGLGNYSTPLVEFNISNLRSKDYSYGAFMHHKSSHSKLRLSNNVNINAGYVENTINIYGKRFFSGVTLSGSLNFDQNAFSYYGYNVDRVPGPYVPDNDSVRQRNYKPGIDVGIKSNYSDGNQMNFDIQAGFDYFIDRQENKEPALVVNTMLSKNFSGLNGGLGIMVDYSRLSSSIDTAANTLLSFNPWISKVSDDWQFRLGLEATADIKDITDFYVYPQANLEIIIIKDVLVPFVGVSGKLQKNSYQNLFEENMFIKPGLSLKNTSSNFIAFGGLKGNISAFIRFRADATLTLFKNYHFFVNDTIRPPTRPELHNQFTAVYDDITLITYHGQLVFASKSDFELSLDGKYFDYRTVEEAKAWHKPDFNISLDAKYSYNKFTFGAGLQLIGNRWVKDYDEPDFMVKLKPVFDANLSINYHYSKVLTVFADFYNLGERSYEIWHQYPSQRFNFLVGFSYKL